MPIEWNDKLSVGNEQIDEDHKHLIKLINAYEKAVASQNYKMLGPAFASLEAYANEHFEREERIMEAVHFPGRRPHRDVHKNLLRTVKKKHAEIESNADVNIDKLTDFLREWLLGHVIKEDMQLKPYLSGGRSDDLI